MAENGKSVEELMSIMMVWNGSSKITTQNPSKAGTQKKMSNEPSSLGLVSMQICIEDRV
jgi:hypothetical protein